MARVLVLVAEGSEELEVVTIIDLLRRAEIEVVVAGLAPGPVRCSRGVVLVPDTDVDSAVGQDYDMVVLPGGQPGANNLEADARVRALLARIHRQGKYVAAICAAPKVLAAAGILDGRSATCFPGAIDVGKYPHVRLESRAVVVDGKVATSRGPGTALDFALELIALLRGKEQRDTVESRLMRPETAADSWG